MGRRKRRKYKRKKKGLITRKIYVSAVRPVTPIDTGYIFPYGDPLVIDMAERVVARLIVSGRKDAEISLVDLSTAQSIDRIECWRAIGLIYLLVAGFGIPFTKEVRNRFLSTLMRFMKFLDRQPFNGYLLTHYRLRNITETIKGLVLYEAKYWGMRVPSVSSYLMKWLGRWGYSWGQVSGKYDKPLVIRIGTTFEEAKHIFIKEHNDSEFEEVANRVVCP